MARKKPDIVFEEADVHALKALSNGTANSAQQQRAIRFFFNASGLREVPYVSDNPLEMAFNEGRKFVGWHVAKLIELVGVTTDPTTKKDK